MSVLNSLVASTLTGDALAAVEAQINASLTAANASLTLAQTSKSTLVDGIFNCLRQAPIAYTVTAGAFTWDATDESVNAMNFAFTSNMQAALVTQINAAFATLALSLVGEGGCCQIEVVSHPQITGSLASQQWTPIGNTAPVTLSGAELAGLASAIIARRASLQATRLSYQAAIAALTTVPQVIAYAASAGWP